MEVKVTVKGAKELEELMLKGLPITVGRSKLLASLRRGATPTMNIAKSIVARRSGALSQSIGMQTVPERQLQGMRGGRFNSKAFAAIRMGPMSGQGAKAFSAWAIYRSYYRGGQINLRKGAPIGRIRHGHLVEFGFTMRDGRKYPARPFMEPAAVAGYSAFNSIFIGDARKRVEAAIRKHNARSPARQR